MAVLTCMQYSEMTKLSKMDDRGSIFYDGVLFSKSHCPYKFSYGVCGSAVRSPSAPDAVRPKPYFGEC